MCSQDSADSRARSMTRNFKSAPRRCSALAHTACSSDSNCLGLNWSERLVQRLYGCGTDCFSCEFEFSTPFCLTQLITLTCRSVSKVSQIAKQVKKLTESCRIVVVLGKVLLLRQKVVDARVVLVEQLHLSWVQGCWGRLHARVHHCCH